MSPEPFVTSQYDHKHSCDCTECVDARFKARNPHLYGADDDPLGPARGLLNAVICSIVIVSCLVGAILIWTQTADARQTMTPKPILRPVGLLEAKQQCPDDASLVECRAALRRALAGVEWQRRARLHQGAYGVQHAIHLASALYGIPLSEMNSVSSCESHQHATSKNRTSTASGLFQFLDSTWNRAGIPGFSVFDPYANAIAAARLVTRDGSWREWSCKP